MNAVWINRLTLLFRILSKPADTLFKFGDLDATKPVGGVKMRSETIGKYSCEVIEKTRLVAGEMPARLKRGSDARPYLMNQIANVAPKQMPTSAKLKIG